MNPLWLLCAFVLGLLIGITIGVLLMAALTAGSRLEDAVDRQMILESAQDGLEGPPPA